MELISTILGCTAGVLLFMAMSLSVVNSLSGYDRTARAGKEIRVMVIEACPLVISTRAPGHPVQPPFERVPVRSIELGRSGLVEAGA